MTTFILILSLWKKMNLKISLKNILTTKPKLSLDVGSNIDDDDPHQDAASWLWL